MQTATTILSFEFMSFSKGLSQVVSSADRRARTATLVWRRILSAEPYRSIRPQPEAPLVCDFQSNHLFSISAFKKCRDVFSASLRLCGWGGLGAELNRR